MKLVNPKLFEKAAAFTDAALTLMDDDGYPFSIPVSFEVDPGKQVIRISKPASLLNPEAQNCGIIFNYVTPLPGGGYTDRRYVVFWGNLQDEGKTCVMKPVKGFVWDEKDVPFFQYSEMKNPRARTYLDKLKIKPWLSTPWLIVRTFRLPFVIATILPVLLGVMIAFNAGFFNPGLLALTLAGAVLIHMGLNVMNDYFDFKAGTDDINTTPTPYSGGSRVLQYGLLSPTSLFSISSGAYLAGAIIGIYIVLTRGLPVLFIGIAGLLISLVYTAPPLKLVYRGLGEFAVAIGFGPILVLGSYFVQSQRFDLAPILASVIPGVLVMLILYVNEIPDVIWDDEASKRTLVARFSESGVRKGYIVSIAAVYASILLAIVAGIFPVTTILALVTIPLAVKVTKSIKNNFGNPYGLMPAMSANIKLFTYTTVLFIIGFAMAGLLHLR